MFVLCRWQEAHRLTGADPRLRYWDGPGILTAAFDPAYARPPTEAGPDSIRPSQNRTMADGPQIRGSRLQTRSMQSRSSPLLRCPPCYFAVALDVAEPHPALGGARHSHYARLADSGCFAVDIFGWSPSAGVVAGSQPSGHIVTSRRSAGNRGIRDGGFSASERDGRLHITSRRPQEA
ncbi:hypothetical protein MMC17_006396 [Xylographa soralifera]|nr:hypothetical protein [Xylographa soralifera]